MMTALSAITLALQRGQLGGVGDVPVATYGERPL